MRFEQEGLEDENKKPEKKHMHEKNQSDLPQVRSCCGRQQEICGKNVMKAWRQQRTASNHPLHVQ